METLAISPQYRYYQKNRDEINRKRREKYKTDFEYRNHAIQKSKLRTLRLREQRNTNELQQ